jgi:hypothetical protein
MIRPSHSGPATADRVACPHADSRRRFYWFDVSLVLEQNTVARAFCATQDGRAGPPQRQPGKAALRVTD